MATGVRLAGRSTGWPHWTTPRNVLDVIAKMGPIALDPCSNQHSIVDAPTAFCGDDGLSISWTFVAGGGLIYVNPPYNQARAFVQKCVYEASQGAEIILLTASRTDTKWAHLIFATAKAVCLWGPGRISFGNPPPESPGEAPSIASMFSYWGERAAEFMAAFHGHGVVFHKGQFEPRAA